MSSAQRVLNALLDAHRLAADGSGCEACKTYVQRPPHYEYIVSDWPCDVVRALGFFQTIVRDMEQNHEEHCSDKRVDCDCMLEYQCYCECDKCVDCESK